MKYPEFFQAATGGRTPFGFQERLRNEAAQWTLLRAPTGLGKTDALLVSWLHRRATEAGRTARRLVWCLPGRALTEQIAKNAEDRIEKAGLKIRVCRLLGGSMDNDLTLSPDEPAVLVGTQDILLSRALNRGYARNPFRWPIDFALLNNDCEWVLDEVQLLGDGLAASTQLAAFRELFGCFGAVRTFWTSATFDPAWLRTVDLAPRAESIAVIAPDEDDLKSETVRMRIHAEKIVERAPVECRMPKGVAEFVATHHQAGTISLVIANTVRRALEIREELAGKLPADLRLWHSRYRSPDRERQVKAALGALPADGRVIVATQVIEAGIDLDASLLVTDVAPYTSLVQRFGRVNRLGEKKGCRIVWVDRPLANRQRGLAGVDDLKPKELESVCAPYAVEETMAGGQLLEGMQSAAPADLPDVIAPAVWQHVLRRTDLLDLFDTSSDLGGNQLDISRFVRSGQERNVYVGWREWVGDAPPAGMREIEEYELCPVPIGDVETLRKEKVGVWSWNAIASEWQRAETLFPGTMVVLHSTAGRYTPESGWSPDSKQPVAPLTGGQQESEGMLDERRSFVSYRQRLEEHTEEVFGQLKRLLDELADLGLEEHRSALEAAARQHDWGKAHQVFQQTMHNTPGPYSGAEILAKQKRQDATRGHSRRFFRHELASALAMLAAGEDDLAAYVTAAHHGRVRVSIRSTAEERLGGRDYIRGLEEGDELLACSLGGGLRRAPTALTLEAAQLGSGPNGASWSSRVLRLRDRWGPFRLAYLEMLLRAADEKASELAAERLK